MKFGLFLLLIFFSLQFFSQNAIDSLIYLYENEKKPENQIEILAQLSLELKYISVDSAIYYSTLAKDIAIENKKEKDIIQQMIYLSKLQIMKSDMLKARETLETCLLYTNSQNDKESKGDILHSIGYTYFYEFNYLDALNFYHEALKIRNEIQDTSGIAGTNNNIGLIYWNLRQYQKALKYFSDALEMYIIIGNENGIGTCYSNMGMIYSEMDNLDSSIFYFNKSLHISKKLSIKSYIASDYANIGASFAKAFEYDSAKNYFLKANKLDEFFENPYGSAIVYLNLADIYVYEQNYDSAMFFIEKAELTANEIHAINILEHVYKQYSRIHFDNGRYKQAYEFFEIHEKYKDSVYDENISQQLMELEYEFSVQNKNEELEFQNLLIKQQDAKLKSQKKSLFYLKLFIASLIILGFFVVLLYIKNRKTLLALRKKNKKIIVQKEKIEEQNKIIIEQNERTKSNIKYARDIVESTLPSENEIKKHFDFFLIFKPKEIVSGDFYQLFEIENGIIFILADCAGHGVPGALLAILNYRILNRLINVFKLTEPSEILERLDNEITEIIEPDSNENKNLVDIAIVKFTVNKENNEEIYVDYSGACRDLEYYNPVTKMLERQQASKTHVGGHINEEKVFETHKLILPLNTTFYLYSDGIVDLTNEDNVRLGRKRLLNRIEDVAELPINEQQKAISNLLDDWNKIKQTNNDMTFVALKPLSVFS